MPRPEPATPRLPAGRLNTGGLLLHRTRAFALVELACLVVLAAVLLIVLVGVGHGSRRAAGIQASVDRLRRISWAGQAYHLDNAGQAPMRMYGYNQGSVVNGWDGWFVGGKNCGVFWIPSFDESAYSRPLNPYLYAGAIPVPAGYVNTGAGSTWTFNPGHPALPDRMGLQLEVFHSPGDRATRERNWPNADPTISGYDDIGTSYPVNMRWWDDPTLPHSSFTAQYNEGSRRIGLAFDGANPNYVWIGDQTMDVAPYFNTATPGEWGKPNASVVGFADGRVQYTHLVPNASSGPGYTLWP